MKTKIELQGDELIQKAFELLIENLGITETSRFIEAIRMRKIDSVKRHQNWQKKLDKESFFKEIFNIM